MARVFGSQGGIDRSTARRIVRVFVRRRFVIDALLALVIALLSGALLWRAERGVWSRRCQAPENLTMPGYVWRLGSGELVVSSHHQAGSAWVDAVLMVDATIAYRYPVFGVPLLQRQQLGGVYVSHEDRKPGPIPAGMDEGRWMIEAADPAARQPVPDGLAPAIGRWLRAEG